MTTVPSEEAFHSMMVQTIVLGLIAFFVSGGLLLAFWKSLAEESESGERQLGPKSRRRLAYVILSLILFGLIFMVIGLRE